MSGAWKVSSGGWSSGTSVRAKPVFEAAGRANSPRRPPSPLLRPPSPLSRSAGAPTSSFPRAPAPTGAAARQSSLRGRSPISVPVRTTQHNSILPIDKPWAKPATEEVPTPIRASFSFPQGFACGGVSEGCADEAEYSRKAASRWVTVYSLDSGDTLVAIQHLSALFGAVKRYHWPAAMKNCNWLHVEFYDPIAASAALCQRHVTMEVAATGGVQVVEFAVEECRDAAVVNAFLGEDLDDFRTHMSLVETSGPKVVPIERQREQVFDDDFESPLLSAAGKLSAMQKRAKTFKKDTRRSSVHADSLSVNSSVSQSSLLCRPDAMGTSVSRGVRSNLTLFGGVSTAVPTVVDGCSRDTYRAAIRNRDVNIPPAESALSRATAADLWMRESWASKAVSSLGEQLGKVWLRGGDAPRIRRRLVADRVSKRLTPPNADSPRMPISEMDLALTSPEHESDVDAALFSAHMPLWRWVVRSVKRSFRRNFLHRLPLRETVCSPAATASNVYVILRPQPWFLSYHFWASLVLMVLVGMLFYVMALYPLMAVVGDWWSEVVVVLFGETSGAPGGSFYYYIFSRPTDPSRDTQAIFSGGTGNGVRTVNGNSYHYI